jgi:WhiB family redox-sensing transcriptional regulator
MTTRKRKTATAGRRGAYDPMAILQEFKLNVEEREWMRRAACRDRQDLDFFEMYPRSRMKRACVAVCDTCPVVSQCLNYAVQNEIWHGIWGGKTPNERGATVPSQGFVTLKP